MDFQIIEAQNWKEFAVSPSSNTSREQIASDGLDIVQAGFHSCFYAILDHSYTEDMVFCPFRALRLYFDIFEILDRGNMFYSSLSR